MFTNTARVWRDNTRGDYWVLDIPSGALRRLGGAAPASTLMFATFSPDGSRVAYVRANNLYTEDADGGRIAQLTKDGSTTTINGTSDWVYEEELFLRDCFRWSPDGTALAYWQFDTTGIGSFTLINNTASLYPTITRIPYPKVGTRNSAVRIGVVGARGGKTRWMRAPGDPRKHYLARLDWVDGRTLAIQQLNRFEADVTDVLDADVAAGWLYSLASPANAGQRYLYRSRLDGIRTPERLTPADSPGTHGYQLAPGSRFAFHTVSRIDQPPVISVIELPDHRPVRALTDPSALRAALAPVLVPPVEFFQIEIPGGVRLDGWMLKPSQFNASRTYPVIAYVYGEPSSQTVVDRWGGNRMLFHRALAEAGYILVSIDNRGTPAPRGRDWRHIVYGAVGDLSSKDQAAAMLALAAKHPFIDRERLGIWGWSGGGSNTLNAMFRFPDVYRVGVSVAPVPDQLLYDTIYQERYMGLPSSNWAGYQLGSPLSFANGLNGKAADGPRLGRRQRPHPRHGAAGQSAGRARQAVRPDDLSQSHPFDQRGCGDHAAPAPADRALLPDASAARPTLTRRPRSARRGVSRRRPGQVAGQMIDDVARVVLDAVDEGRLAAAQHRQAERVQPGDVRHDAAVVTQVRPSRPAPARAASGSPDGSRSPTRSSGSRRCARSSCSARGRRARGSARSARPRRRRRRGPSRRAHSSNVAEQPLHLQVGEREHVAQAAREERAAVADGGEAADQLDAHRRERVEIERRPIGGADQLRRRQPPRPRQVVDLRRSAGSTGRTRPSTTARRGRDRCAAGARARRPTASPAGPTAGSRRRAARRSPMPPTTSTPPSGSESGRR